mgnify:CR=1 FL=1
MSKKKRTTLKDFLKDKLSDSKISLVNRSFEIVGDIAIIEIPQELDSKSKVIADALLQVNKNIKTVLKKSGIHSGEFRTQNLVYVAGEDKKETIYKESGIKLKINPETVYFSPRLSTERENLMTHLDEKRVLVMFSGSGPYSFVALKKQPDLKRILSIEINPQGHKYALENKKLNKNLVKKSKLFKDIRQFLKSNNLPFYEKKLIDIFNDLFVNFICGDVREVVQDIRLKEYDEKVYETENYLFNGKAEDIFYKLKINNEGTLFVDLNQNVSSDYFIYFLIIFSSKYNYVIKTGDKWYVFKDNYSKGVLINYLMGDCDINRVDLYDEIYMPLPKDASNFLDTVFEIADTHAIVHMYDFVHENEYPILTEEKVLRASQKHSKRVEIIETRKVGQYSPRKYRVCCDFKILD